MQEIEFFYDFGSPNAYLVHCTLPGLAARHQAQVIYHPMLLGGVFKATNNQSPFQAFSAVTHKLGYIGREVARFCERYDLPFVMNPHFPINTLRLMRGAIFAQGHSWGRAYIDAVFNAIWLEERDMNNPDIVQEVLSKAGLPVDDILQAAQDPAVKQVLIGATEDAVAAGVFGAPSMIVKGELFFGKDSLDDLDWRLAQA